MTDNVKNTLLVLAAGSLIILFLLIERPNYLADSFTLGTFVAAELIFAAVLKYKQVFFAVLITLFLLAGSHLPMQGAFLQARWVVLGIAAAAGLPIYIKDRNTHFGVFHLVAFFCVLSAAVSAFVSQYPSESRLKAVSLLLLFLYAASGVRVAVPAFRPERFFRRALLSCEILVWITGVCYLVLSFEFLGNPNSLGAVMGVAVVPMLFWGLLIAETNGARIRLGFELALGCLLLMSSFARAGIGAAAISSVLVCVSLRRYQFLIKSMAAALVIAVCAVAVLPHSVRSPEIDPSESVQSVFLYKGHTSTGIFGSRKSVWQQTWTSIEQNPWFGTGFGTSLISGDLTRLHYAQNHSDSWVQREHGNSYLAIAEWTGLLGVVPFYFLIALTAVNAGKAFIGLRRTGNVFSATLPAAAIIAAGLFHAIFEDWMFAVGYYLCVFFWAIAFIMVDLKPQPAVVYPPEMFVPMSSRYAGAAASSQ
jgi:O-antigen ligase